MVAGRPAVVDGPCRSWFGGFGHPFTGLVVAALLVSGVPGVNFARGGAQACWAGGAGGWLPGSGPDLACGGRLGGPGPRAGSRHRARSWPVAASGDGAGSADGQDADGGTGPAAGL